MAADTIMFIRHNKPCVGEDEMKAVTRVINEQWLIAGSEVAQFEKDFAASVGRKYAVAVNSGTAALHVSLLSLKLQKGDEIILPTYTASDILNAIHYVGALPVLVDIEKDSCIIDNNQIGKKITKKTKSLIIPHTFGFPVAIPSFTQFGIPIIEDCAQSIGSIFSGKPVGAFGETSIFSFFATKLLTTGQGGMVVTDDKQKYLYIRDIISYNGRDTYAIRFNYPLTDIAAGIGRVQLAKYPLFAKRRKEIASIYQKTCEEKGIWHTPTKQDKNVVPFRFLMRVPEKRVNETIDLFAKKMIEIKQPIAPFELLHQLLKKNKKDFPNAEKFAATTLSLPMYPCLKNEELERIVSALTEVL